MSYTGEEREGERLRERERERERERRTLLVSDAIKSCTMMFCQKRAKRFRFYDG